MTLLVQRSGPVLRLTLDRVEQGNRLDRSTLSAIEHQLRELDRDPDPARVLILDANGPDFSLGRQRDPSAPANPKAITAEFELIQRVNEALSDCLAVTVAALHGRAEGAALSLAARCDVVIAADDSRLSFPEIPHGIPPTIVLSHYRYVLPHSILGDLIFTGRELNGEEAVSAGLAARHVPGDRLRQSVDELAQEISGHDRDSMRLVKRFLQVTRSMSPRDAPATGIALYAVEMADRALVTDSARRKESNE